VYGLPRPFDTSHPAYLLVEAADRVSPADDLAAGVASLDVVAATAVAVDAARRAALWRYREAQTEAINTLGPPHKLDVSLPSDRVAAFTTEARRAVEAVAPEARTFLFGHAAEGNVHVNVTGVAPDDERVDEAVLHLVVEMGGSVSAEHGIGSAKRRWLAFNRSPAEIAAFRAIKHALDPDGILNPNVLLPPASDPPGRDGGRR
ncbi:MAG: FAD-binding oxidoreductase, partial [Acidimicrobiales bacterium]